MYLLRRWWKIWRRSARRAEKLRARSDRHLPKVTSPTPEEIMLLRLQTEMLDNVLNQHRPLYEMRSRGRTRESLARDVPK